MILIKGETKSYIYGISGHKPLNTTNMTIRQIIYATSILALPVISSCSKSNDNQAVVTPPVILPVPVSLDYGDTVFYLNNQKDNIIQPVQAAAGSYSGFPEGIEIDATTGAIDLGKSETGLRYVISFLPQGKTDTIKTEIVIAGINFLDGFHILANGDSILHPIYNANPAAIIPGVNNGSIFDDGSHCNSLGCNVNTVTGDINLSQTVRNAVFGSSPSNNDREQFEYDYRISDKSGNALNSLQVKLYYFSSMDQVTQEAYDIITSRVGTILNLPPVAIPGFHNATYSTAPSSTTAALQSSKPAKPRPPCIFIVGH